MSIKKLFLAVAALALVTAVQMGNAPTAQAWPEPPQDCMDVVVWATNPATGECTQFPNPCSVPQGWTVSYTGCVSNS